MGPSGNNLKASPHLITAFSGGMSSSRPQGAAKAKVWDVYVSDKKVECQSIICVQSTEIIPHASQEVTVQKVLQKSANAAVSLTITTDSEARTQCITG